MGADEGYLISHFSFNDYLTLNKRHNDQRDGTRYLVLTKSTLLSDCTPHEIWLDKLYWLQHHQKITQFKVENFDKYKDEVGNLGYLLTGATQESREEVLGRLRQCYSEVVTILSSEVNRSKKDGSNKLEDIFYFHIGLSSILEK